MKASKVLSTVTKGVGAVTLVAAAIVAGMLAYASVKAPRTGRSIHV